MLAVETTDRVDEEADALPLAKLSEERKATDPRALRSRWSRLPECRGLPEVLDDLSRLGDRPAVRTHPAQQPCARAHDRVGELEGRAFGDLLAAARDRVGDLARRLGEDARRAMAVDDERRVPKRPGGVPQPQSPIREPAPVVGDDDVGRIVA